MKNKKIIYMLLIMVVLFGIYLLINKNFTNKTDSEFANNDNTEQSVDWVGRYTGTTPCADCEGIKTDLTLNSNKTFSLKEEYITTKAGQKFFESKGAFVWSQDGSMIITKDDIGDIKNYFVGEGYVEMLGVDGKRAEGDMAKEYILKKVEAIEN